MNEIGRVINIKGGNKRLNNEGYWRGPNHLSPSSTDTTTTPTLTVVPLPLKRGPFATHSG